MLTFNAASLASSASGTATVVVIPTSDGGFTSAAGVTSDATYFDPGNNTANTSVTVNDNAGIPLLKISHAATSFVLSWSTNQGSCFTR
jgi:hypothetical protein